MSLLDAFMSQDSGQARAGPLGAVLQMLNAQPGGLPGVVQKFEAAGLGGVAQSWLGGGANQPVSAGQVQSALGPDAVSQVAGQLGTSQEDAAGHISQFLPLIMDHLSGGGAQGGGAGGPNGGLAGLGGLLERFA